MLRISSVKPCWRLHKHLFLLVTASGIASAETVQHDTENDSLTFDTSVISERGMDPKIAELFRHAPRFIPGEHNVTLTINGHEHGRAKARFDHNGVLCANQEFLEHAGLVSPPGYTQETTCFDLRNAWPQMEVFLDPGEGRVDLIVPAQALNTETKSKNWQHGGYAGMLNYDVQYMDSYSHSDSVSFGQLNTSAGLNINDWIFRSRQTFTRFDGKDEINHQAAYVQRSFVDIEKVLQAGQISLSNSLFGTGQVLGFQMFPETALTNYQGGAGLVEGVADTPSVVEVRQSGVLVYSTTVPTGPFRLQGFSLLNTRTDLVVNLTDSTGQTRQFTVPAATLLSRTGAVSPGLSFGAGKSEQHGEKSPLLGTIATGWQLTPYTSLNTGVLGSSLYRAWALSLDTQLLETTQLSLQDILSQDAENHHTGTMVSAILNHNVTERFNISINGRQQTYGYRELDDTLLKTESNDFDNYRNHYQWGGGIGWSADTLGDFSLSWARNTTYRGDNMDYLRVGWNRQFGQIYLGVNLERNTETVTGQKDDRLYASLSMPLGKGRSMNSYINTAHKTSRAGLRYSERTSQDRGWSLSGERDWHNNTSSVSGNLDYVAPVSQLSAGVSHSTNRYTSWSALVSGAVVAHQDGITLSPYRVTDTFGIARVGEESGIKLDTPAGPVWTDSYGFAVLPSLNHYKRTGIQLDTRSLSRNVDISNAWQEASVARGSVAYINFDVVRTRRVLVDSTMSDGKPLPHGASVFNQEGELVTVVGENGTVFVPDAKSDMKLEVQNSGKTLCHMSLVLPEKADLTSLYEKSTVLCQ